MVNNFQKNIKRIMVERGLTQLGLAGMINMRQSQVSNWINGKSLPTYGSLVILRDKLQIDIAEFFRCC